MEQKLISPDESLPNNGEIVNLILYDKSREAVLDQFFVSVFYDGDFLTGSRSALPIDRVYKWSPTGKYYNPFKEANTLIQDIIDSEDNDDNDEDLTI